jgi:hypothetical protein
LGIEIIPALKRLATSVLLITLIFQSFSGAGIFVNYYVNYSLYVKNCENKNRPAMHCNGQCQAMKQWKKAENNGKHETDKPQQRNEALSSRSFFAASSFGLPALMRVFMPGSQSENTRDITIPVFHPPCA